MEYIMSFLMGLELKILSLKFVFSCFSWIQCLLSIVFSLWLFKRNNKGGLILPLIQVILMAQWHLLFKQMLLSLVDLVLKLLRILIPVLPRIRKEKGALQNSWTVWIAATRSMEILVDINSDPTTILMMLLIKFLLLMINQIDLILLEVLFRISTPINISR